MPGHEEVVIALLRVRIAHQPPLRADGAELVVAAGDQLMRIDLMTRVPDQAVTAEVEGGVQGQAELDHSQVRREVGDAVGDYVAQHLAHLGRKLLQLGQREPLQVARRLDL